MDNLSIILLNGTCRYEGAIVIYMLCVDIFICFFCFVDKLDKHCYMICGKHPGYFTMWRRQMGAWIGCNIYFLYIDFWIRYFGIEILYRFAYEYSLGTYLRCYLIYVWLIVFSVRYIIIICYHGFGRLFSFGFESEWDTLLLSEKYWTLNIIELNSWVEDFQCVKHCLHDSQLGEWILFI